MPKTLLLADDSVTIQKVVGISFANEDIEITTVDNGRDAVAKARTIRPDIILADVVMPGLSGYEVCEAVKADPNLRHVPVLLLTGTFEAFDQARATAVGAAGHVAKPFEAQTLVDRVKQLLAAAPAPRASAPQSAPAAASASVDDAFDFFSDEPKRVVPAPPPVPSASAFDLDEPDAAFEFGDEDLAEAPPAPAAAPGRRAEATVAILAAAPGGSQDDAFEFSFDGNADTLEPIDAEDPLAHTALLDPEAHSEFDVSSSDIAPSRAPDSATQLFSMDDDGPESLALEAEDAEFDLAEPEPFAAPEAMEPLGADPFETTLPPIERAPRGQSFDPFAREPFEAEPVLAGEPLSAGEEVEAEPWDDASYAASPALEVSSAASGAPELSRAELHDMLEKIAWDAFAPITEKIVREAIARIEQVAWEVVPKLAETLIQEEIRRLKGGGSS